jgi:hypothetical protein
MSKYPVYIVSKGRAQTQLTAKAFIRDDVNFYVLVEPHEVKAYQNILGNERVIELPFANLGQGSFPARNHAWELAKQQGAKRHWVFDDNIYGMGRFVKGKKVPCHAGRAIEFVEEFTDRYTNLAISAFNYRYFVPTTISKPFFLNVHCYSAMLIETSLPFRWRLKYNEDVDLCLQALHAGYCTTLINAFFVDKVSTVTKMAGGNQDELYKNNATEKKILKARSLEMVWPQYVTTAIRFGRPHHVVDWKRYFQQALIRRNDIDWNAIQAHTPAMRLVPKQPVNSRYDNKEAEPDSR